MVRKKIILVTVLCMIFVLVFSFISFADIAITKKTDKGSYAKGEKVKVLYEIINPFPNDIEVILTDRNIINGEYGYDLQCLKFGLPANGRGILDLAQSGIDIEFYAREHRNHTLEPARLMFENPSLNIVDESVSNTVTLEVKDSDVDVSGIELQVQTLNFCNEEEQEQQQQQQEQQENQPSKEEVQKEKQQQQEDLEKRQKEMQDQYNQQSQTQKDLQRAQQGSNQNAQATKETFEKQRQRNEQQRQELENAIQNSSEFKEAKEQLEKEGFEPVGSNVTAKGNSTGDMTTEFENKETGERAQVQTSMEEGEVESLKNSQDIKKNEDYQALKESLEKQGFEEQDNFDMAGEKFSSEFKNPQTGETRDVTGEYEKGKVDDVKSEYPSSRELLEKIMNNNNTNNKALVDKLAEMYNGTIPEDALKITQHAKQNPQITAIKNSTSLKEPVDFNATTGELLEKPNFEEESPWKKRLIIAGSLSLLLTAALVYMYRKKELELLNAQNNAGPVKKEIDYHKEARKLLKLAEEEYAQGEKKKAYETASYAIRLFHSHKLGYGFEVTAYKLIKLMKERNIDYKIEQKTLNLCGLVEFAKYEANDKDFNQIIDNAKKIIG